MRVVCGLSEELLGAAVLRSCCLRCVVFFLNQERSFGGRASYPDEDVNVLSDFEIG